MLPASSILQVVSWTCVYAPLNHVYDILSLLVTFYFLTVYQLTHADRNPRYPMLIEALEFRTLIHIFRSCPGGEMLQSMYHFNVN